AMQNWGLITFREGSVLADSQNAPTYQLERVGYTICHELVHQWAGDLVTPTWWDDLWLNEGFATFLGYYVLDNLQPHWNNWLGHQCGEQNNAFNSDAQEDSTHPIEVQVIRADDADDVFDAISYHKSCIIIRMMFNFIGEESFKVGFTNYLKKHAYKNAVSTDLWEALAESSGFKELPQMMQSWTQQEGFPLVSVKEIKQEITEKRKQQLIIRENEDIEEDQYYVRVFEFTQQKFSQKNLRKITEGQKNEEKEKEKDLFIKDKQKEEDKQQDNNPIWKIPVAVYQQNGSQHLNGSPLTKTQPIVGLSQLNEMMAQLNICRSTTSLSASDRMGIQNDLAALALKGGAFPYVQYLKFVRSAYWHEQCIEVRQDIIGEILSTMNIFMEGIVAGNDAEKVRLEKIRRLKEKEKEKENAMRFRGRWANYQLNQNTGDNQLNNGSIQINQSQSDQKHDNSEKKEQQNQNIDT
ncbi:MAG: putative Aminopeptidase 2, partial [Streblomastix strix]